MIDVVTGKHRTCDGVTRRDLIKVGGLTLLGLTLPDLLRMEAAAAAEGVAAAPRARTVILLFMAGGPPQHETWDPKPEAPAEVRGPFKAIPTSVAGLQVGELMPRLAKLAHRYAVIRSVSTEVNAHTGSGYWMTTGHPHPNRNGESLEPSSSDWPHLGAVVKRMLPGGRDLPPVVKLTVLCKHN